MAGYKVEICGVNTSDLPLLKPAQAKELLVKINQEIRRQEKHL